MKSSQLHRNVSAYLFAMAITLIICAFGVGIFYVDMSANDTIMSAGGLLYPIEEKLLEVLQKIFAFAPC